MNSLPNECLTLIMDRIPLVELIRNIPLVCHKWKSLLPIVCARKRSLLINFGAEVFTVTKATVVAGIDLQHNNPLNYIPVPFLPGYPFSVDLIAFESLPELFPNIVNLEICEYVVLNAQGIEKMITKWSTRNRMQSLTLIWNIYQMNKKQKFQLKILDQTITKLVNSTLTRIVLCTIGRKKVKMPQSAASCLVNSNSKLTQIDVDTFDKSNMMSNTVNQVDSIRLSKITTFALRNLKFNKISTKLFTALVNLTHLTLYDNDDMGRTTFKPKHLKMITDACAHSLIYLNIQVKLKYAEIFPLIPNRVECLRIGYTQLENVDDDMFDSIAQIKSTIQLNSVKNLHVHLDTKDKVQLIERLCYNAKTIFPNLKTLHLSSVILFIADEQLFTLYEQSTFMPELCQLLSKNFAKLSTIFWDQSVYDCNDSL